MATFPRWRSFGDAVRRPLRTKMSSTVWGTRLVRRALDGPQGPVPRQRAKPSQQPPDTPPSEMTNTENPPLERKLVAIVAADVVGYSRLMHHNEERTLATLT